MIQPLAEFRIETFQRTAVALDGTALPAWESAHYCIAIEGVPNRIIYQSGADGPWLFTYPVAWLSGANRGT